MVLAHAADIVGFGVVALGFVVMRARAALKARRAARELTEPRVDAGS